jgi:hypothetical protein
MYFVIDKHNAAVEPRKGTFAVFAMVWAVVAARIVYWMRFLNFAVVGMAGIFDGRAAVHRRIYILLCSSHRYCSPCIPSII